MDRARLSRAAGWLALLILLAPAGGCASGLASLIYLVRGYDVPAKWDGLEGKRVVVVVRPPQSLGIREATVAPELARMVEMRLAKNGNDIETIEQEDVSEWMDENVWHDFSEVGRALEAEYVVGIELISYSMHQSQTIFQGKAVYQVQVTKVSDGSVAFEEGPSESVYPPNVGVTAMERSEREFRAEYLNVLAEEIGVLFYEHDKYHDFGQDGVALE